MVYGIILSVIIAIIANLLSYIIPIGNIMLAIFLGIFTKNIILRKIQTDIFDSGIQFTEKKLLPLAIMLLGLELNISVLAQLGIKSFIFIIMIIIFTLLIGFFVSKYMGFDKEFGILLGVGNAVCGASAILATAPVLKSDKESITLSIAAVNMMGGISLILMPIFAKIIYFNDLQAGLLIGGSIQAVGQVIASGFSVNNSVGEIATLIKMGRVLMLGFVVLFLNIFLEYSKKSKNENQSKKNILSYFSIPYFIVVFFIFSILASSNIIPLSILDIFKLVGNWLLVITMAGIGLKINMRPIIKQGSKVILTELLITASQVSAIVIFLFIFY